MKYSPVRKLAAGQGRDFVVGDIHGAFHLVMRALEAVAFNPADDRLFSVGDLVDRGPYSEQALAFLREPWVHAVRGNHEQMILDLYANGELNEAALEWNVNRNGMAWWLQVPSEKKAEFLLEFSKLPIALEVETPRGRVGLVHAEVPLGMDWPTFVKNLESGENRTLQSALWGRTRVERRCADGVRGIDRIFAGHTVNFTGIQQLGNVFIVDTGAVFSYLQDQGKLSVSNVMAQTGLLRAPASLPQLNLVTSISNNPFGLYAK